MIFFPLATTETLLPSKVMSKLCHSPAGKAAISLGGITLAASKIKDKLQDMRDGYDYLLNNLHEVDAWVEDLIFDKTLKGFEIQSEVLSYIAGDNPWRLSTPYEESLGIDGFINEKPYQIKPHTAKHLATVNQQTIKAEIVYYKKVKGNLIIE